MKQAEQKAAARKFASEWQGRGDEKGETQRFWIGLLSSVFGLEEAERFIEFEKRVGLKNTSFIDIYIPSSKVLIEQKSLGINLRAKAKQSDGSELSPFEQAHRYASYLPHSEHPRWIITCNFESFLVYDMNSPKAEPEEILLQDLEKEFYRLSFLLSQDDLDASAAHLRREMELSVKAGEIVGKIYDKLHAAFLQASSGGELSGEDYRALNILCVRLVFCLYAEDAGLFSSKSQFHDYLNNYSVKELRRAIVDLFKVLDTPLEQRDRFLEAELGSFPYVNGGLFSEENLPIPQFTFELKQLLLEEASENFNWSEISPTIFGAVFESTLNPDTRRKGGMHYTSIENIHKVIDPLFMNDLRAELETIKAENVLAKRVKKIQDFQNKISSLRFLDPACGSGNFLTETFISLAKLELEALRASCGSGLELVSIQPKVNIGQFFGIEINDFAVTVAKTALWIAESQVCARQNEILIDKREYLPLVSYPNIVCGNALRVEWTPGVDYIIGNPPFVGYTYQSAEQKEDIQSIMPNFPKTIDFVACWFIKAKQYMLESLKTQTALVATNSITQGEQASILWKSILTDGVEINFAYRTFRWDSESSDKAAVHCVIVGFGAREYSKYIFDGDNKISAQNINSYLLDAPSVFIEKRKTSICDAPIMQKGNIPVDDGNLIIENNEYEEFIAKEPQAKKFIRPLIGAEEFINNKKRWCLWLVDVSPAELRKMPMVMARIEAVKEFRLKSTKEATRKYADYANIFMEIRQPNSKYLLIPSTSSENREYVPIGFLDKDSISTNANLIIPSATLYHFGILTSSVHNAWMRAVCGRLEMRYRYSKDIVYNNFIWCSPTEEQKSKIEQTAQGILDARANYPDSSLADLYDPLTMPSDLRKAHQANDKAVLSAYGWQKDTQESEIVQRLMAMYQERRGGNM